MTGESEKISIAVLDYPGAQQSAVHGLTDMFLTANRLSAELRDDPDDVDDVDRRGPEIEVGHWRLARDGSGLERRFTSAKDADRQGTGHAGADQKLAAIIVPPSLDETTSDPCDGIVMRWLVGHHDRGTVLCSICAGALYLAEAGLLDRRSATTHWAWAESFAARFPQVRLQPDKMVIDDGDIMTAGGVMAWVDLGLRLIDRFLGPSVMLAVARFFLVDPGGREQRFYSTFAPRLQHGDAAVLKVQHWLQQCFDQAVTVEDMTGRAGLSPRTFLRRFDKATGMTPLRYLQTLRVGKARGLLETSQEPINRIAWRVGYEDIGAFRKVFLREVGLSPGDYRRRFSIG